jgi:hypothetical protein
MYSIDWKIKLSSSEKISFLSFFYYAILCIPLRTSRRFAPTYTHSQVTSVVHSIHPVPTPYFRRRADDTWGRGYTGCNHSGAKCYSYIQHRTRYLQVSRVPLYKYVPVPQVGKGIPEAIIGYSGFDAESRSRGPSVKLRTTCMYAHS